MKANNGNSIDIEAKAKAAQESGCNYLVIDLNCGWATGLIDTPHDSTGKDVFLSSDGE